MEAIDLPTLRERIFAYLEGGGACSVGICDRAGLEGGPPSVDLSRELEGARTAIVFAVPQDEAKLELYMGKIDQGPYQADYIQTNNLVTGLSAEVARLLESLGHEARVVFAGNTPSGGDSRDVQPANDWQRAAAERHPAKPHDFMIGTIPVLSQRHLAAASGVGFFGMSGNILTPSHGAAVVLGAVVTSAAFEPTPVLPREANYCDECNWCGEVCPTKFMSRSEFVTIEMGAHDHHKYSKREHPARCGMHMTGVAGLSRDGKFSSWGPGRKPIPDDDDALLPAFMQRGVEAAGRPPVPGGFTDIATGRKTNIMCSACNLVCHPEKSVRARRLKMWRQGGVTVQHEDGRVEAMPVDEARAFLDAMPLERRRLYEEVEE